MAAEHPVKARCGVCARAARTWEDDSCGRLMAIDPPGDDWHFGGGPSLFAQPLPHSRHTKGRSRGWSINGPTHGRR